MLSKSRVIHRVRITGSPLRAELRVESSDQVLPPSVLLYAPAPSTNIHAVVSMMVNPPIEVAFAGRPVACIQVRPESWDQKTPFPVTSADHMVGLAGGVITLTSPMSSPRGPLSPVLRDCQITPESSLT